MGRFASEGAGHGSCSDRFDELAGVARGGPCAGGGAGLGRGEARARSRRMTERTEIPKRPIVELFKALPKTPRERLTWARSQEPEHIADAFRTTVQNFDDADYDS